VSTHIVIEGVLIRIINDGLKEDRNVRDEKGINNLIVKIVTCYNARALLLVYIKTNLLNYYYID
jgi:hypothetical protein